jgi:hypothetical protein
MQLSYRVPQYPPNTVLKLLVNDQEHCRTDTLRYCLRIGGLYAITVRQRACVPSGLVNPFVFCGVATNAKGGLGASRTRNFACFHALDTRRREGKCYRDTNGVKPK